MKANIAHLSLLLNIISCVSAQSVITVSINTAVCSIASSALNSIFSPSIAANLTSSSVPLLSSSFRETTSSRISTPSSSSSSPSATPDLTSFLLTYQANVNRQPPRKRDLEPRADDEGYIKADGTAQNDCKTTSRFALVDGQLFYVNGSDGSRSLYSVPAGGNLAAFVPTANASENAITRTWSLQSGTLQWASEQFLNGVAGFCLLDSGDIIVYYGVAVPSDCLTVVFSIEPLAACPGYVGDTNVTVTSPSSSIVGSTSSAPISSAESTSSDVSSSTSVESSTTPTVSPSVSAGTSGGTSISSGSSSVPFANSSSTLPISTPSNGPSYSPSLSSNSSTPLYSFPNNSTSGPTPTGTPKGTSPFYSAPNNSSFLPTPTGTSTPPQNSTLPELKDPKCGNATGRWSLFYYGRGHILNISAPALEAGGQQPYTHVFNGSLSVCEAVQATIASIGVQDFSTFELIFDKANRQWIYGAFPGSVNESTYFSAPIEVFAADIYGYSAPRNETIPTPSVVTDPKCTNSTGNWTFFHAGSGTVLTDSDPALKVKSDEDVLIWNFDKNLTACEAITASVEWLGDQNAATFELILDDVLNVWVLQAYPGSVNDTSSFNRTYPEAKEVYGFSRPEKPPAAKPCIPDPACSPSGNWTNFFHCEGESLVIVDSPYNNYVYSGSLTDCQAFTTCRKQAEALFRRTFDLAYIPGGNQWQCSFYKQYTDDPTLFQKDTYVSKSYGYSLAETGCSKNDLQYSVLYFQGYGSKLDPSIALYSLSDEQTPITRSKTRADYTLCEMLKYCQDSVVTDGYLSFQVFASGANWVCIEFSKQLKYPEEFAADASVEESYGYYINVP